MERTALMGAIDYWCNTFTAEGLERHWRQQPEIMEVVSWWGMEPRLVARTVPEFLAFMDEGDVDAVMIPSAKMASYTTQRLIWDVSEDEVVAIARQAPGRIYGLFGIDPREGMAGVRRLEATVRDSDGVFLGAHLHPYGFGLEINHRRYYPFYAKCSELGIPVVIQVGHSAERMPSALGRPILLDDIALDFPDLTLVGAHTGWPWIEEMMAAAWKHLNVYVGTSAHHPRYWDPALVRFADGRGRGKVLFGTDWPVMDYADALGAIDGLKLRDEAKRLLVGDAARKVFGIG
jgi:predicted TIM-barrel fold metal-dependent hydrolase